MKIALLGYGRMGKAIEKTALQRGHEIVLKVDEYTTNYDITLADIAIDFSIPSAAFNNITHCFEQNVPVVSGTTGWLKEFKKATELCKQHKGGFIYASNFSLGVTIFFQLNKYLANMMQQFDQYQISIKEIHHTKKLDAPSGTAISLAEGIIQHSNKNCWVPGVTNNESEIPIVSERLPNVSGTHEIEYKSDIDTIAIKHTAHNRDGFALGAVIAAEWLIGKTGVFTMNDVLGLK